MANAIQQNLQRLAGQVRSGPVGKFFSWWLEELKLAMPASWQRKLLHALRRVTLASANGSLTIAVDENRRLETLQSLSSAQDISLKRQEIQDLLHKHDLQESPRFLLLDPGVVLRRELELPQAAESNFRQVLTFEMDRQTPFKAKDVYFDWRILGRNADTGQVALELFVVPRPEVDQAVQSAADLGFTLTGVDLAEEGNTLGLNLLPPEQRVRVVNRKSRANLVLAAAAALLLVLVMTQSLYLRSHQVAELEEAIANVQGEARKVSRIRKQIEDQSEAAGFLALRRSESPLAIDILNDVTRLLPDDTYLDRLVIGVDTVQMQGKSQNAQRLIERVNESGLFSEAAFRGSTRLDSRSGLEIFEVSAKIQAVN